MMRGVMNSMMRGMVNSMMRGVVNSMVHSRGWGMMNSMVRGMVKSRGSNRMGLYMYMPRASMMNNSRMALDMYMSGTGMVDDMTGGMVGGRVNRMDNRYSSNFYIDNLGRCLFYFKNPWLLDYSWSRGKVESWEWSRSWEGGRYRGYRKRSRGMMNSRDRGMVNWNGMGLNMDMSRTGMMHNLSSGKFCLHINNSGRRFFNFNNPWLLNYRWSRGKIESWD